MKTILPRGLRRNTADYAEFLFSAVLSADILNGICVLHRGLR
jgi:hypothetical protein